MGSERADLYRKAIEQIDGLRAALAASQERVAELEEENRRLVAEILDCADVAERDPNASTYTIERRLREIAAALKEPKP